MVVVDGDAANLKITNPLDLQIAELLLGEARDRYPRIATVPSSVRPSTSTPTPTTRPDVDPRWGPLEGERGWRGTATPTSSRMSAAARSWGLQGSAISARCSRHRSGAEGADSIELLRRAADAVRAAGWHPGNIDLSVVLDRPKLVSVKDACNATFRRRRLSRDHHGPPHRRRGCIRTRRRCRRVGCCPGSSMSARGRNSKPQPKGGRGRPVKNTAKGRGKVGKGSRTGLAVVMVSGHHSDPYA